MAPDDTRELSRTYCLVAVLLASAAATFIVYQTMAFEADLSSPAASPPVRADIYTKITIDFGNGTKRTHRDRDDRHDRAPRRADRWRVPGGDG